MKRTKSRQIPKRNSHERVLSLIINGWWEDAQGKMPTRESYRLTIIHHEIMNLAARSGKSLQLAGQVLELAPPRQRTKYLAELCNKFVESYL